MNTFTPDDTFCCSKLYFLPTVARNQARSSWAPPLPPSLCFLLSVTVTVLAAEGPVAMVLVNRQLTCAN